MEAIAIPLPLAAAWPVIWRGLRAVSVPPLSPLAAHYHEPGRYYHTLDHVLFCLQALPDEVDGLTPTESLQLRLALYYHDAVYNPRAAPGQNEEASAAVAKVDMLAAGLPTVDCLAVAELIQATDHRRELTDQPFSRRLIADVDLAFFGEPNETFRLYDRQVRQEYPYLSDEDYRAGRAVVLRHFLDRPRIYHTPTFAELEEPARDNLSRRWRELRDGAPV